MPQETMFSADVRSDPALGSTVVSLAYTDAHDPARSMLVSVAPELGSNLFRFRVGEYEIIYCEQELLKRCDFTGDFVLWPLPNRVRDKRYSYHGQTYSLMDIKRPGGNAVLIHGLVFDQPWQYEQPEVGSESASVTTYIDVTPDSPWYASYPFDSRLALTYTLKKDGVSITYHVYNKGTRELPFGFALHPYFSLLSGAEQTVLQVPTRTLMEADNELLPTGRLLNLDSIMYAMFDLRRPRPVANLLLDHVYTDLQPGAPAVITYKQQGMQLHISTSNDFTHAVIYTPPGNPFFCLEHQTCSTDAVNLANQGAAGEKMAHLLEVQPGASYTGSIHYKLYFDR